MAELLGIPQVTHATAVSVEDGRVRARRETERGEETWTSSTPVAVTIERGPDPPEPAEDADPEVEEVEAEKLGGTPREYGTRGSPTFVQEVRELSLERETERLESADEGAERLVALLDGLERSADESTRARGGGRRTLLVLAEHDRDALNPISLEEIACAREVAGALQAQVVAALFCAEPEGLERELGAHGADRVLVVRDPKLSEYATAPFTDALCAAIDESEPFAVIAPWTARGRDYVPRAAARLGLGLTGDFVRLEVAEDDDEGDPDLLWIKPAWAGTVESPIITHRAPSVGTLRPGVFRPLSRREDGEEVPVDELEPDLSEPEEVACEGRERVIEDERLLDCSAVVVCVGEELDEDGIERARDLVDAVGGSLGATKGAVESGHVPAQLEVSILKRSMSPLLLVALGVREDEDLDAVRASRRPLLSTPTRRRPSTAVRTSPSSPSPTTSSTPRASGPGASRAVRREQPTSHRQSTDTTSTGSSNPFSASSRLSDTAKAVCAPSSVALLTKISPAPAAAAIRAAAWTPSPP